jgi:hypothetical protein
MMCIFFISMIFSCKPEAKKPETLFDLMDNKTVGIDFSNNLTDKPDFNIYKYRNYYNGGGVAIGDINNDGLPDIYMVANQTENKLYINKGDWKFEDITSSAGVGGTKAWSTGVTMVDINGDGWLDIYVCNSGDVKGDNKENELFINNGDMTFTESAAQYGLNDPGYSTHASFFDYDKDGDLDVYILNNSFQAIGSFNLRKNERPVRDPLGGDKLYRNDDGKFTDVSAQAGIYGSVIGFGLGISVGDVNNDGWEDIYISNDFFERDYLYINQKDGSFREDLVNQIMATSAASMGADIADINNDGYNDIFVTDMLPSEYARIKTVTTFDNWDRYIYGVNNGYHHQFTRNTLQLNNGNGTFSEISRLAGVEASDWSWGALFFDMDNDGHKDLFIANGIYRDLTDQDYLQYIANESVMASIIKDEGVDYDQLISIIPSRPVANHAYRNESRLLFKNYVESGLLTPGFSNGSAYGDLDNDGDLDLIVNNVNMPCFVYKNRAREQNNQSYIKITLKGDAKNTAGIGSRIRVSSVSGHNLYYDVQPARGFQSSMDPRVNIGLGNLNTVDIRVVWPSGKVTELRSVQPNQMLTLYEKEELADALIKPDLKEGYIKDVSDLFSYIHSENNYVDFNRERLNYHFLSTQGPKVAVGDVNNDGIADFVIPGPKDQVTQIWQGNKNGSYTLSPATRAFEWLKEAEHIACHLFDADGDGDPDLYLASGGVELSEYSELLFDALFLNDGKGNFTDSGQRLPDGMHKISTGIVTSADIDQDGDLDLFVGERVKIGQYGALCSGFILVNDGKGNFTNETSTRGAVFKDFGMFTDAVFADLDGDNLPELIAAGEFMPLSIFKNKNGKFELLKQLENSSGWWNTLRLADLDNDGDMDIIGGNHGLNSRFNASPDRPVMLYFNDFDANGDPEAVLCNVHDNGRKYPYALRHTLTTRMPVLKKKFPDFQSFREADMLDIFGEDKLKASTVWSAVEMANCIFINDGNYNFRKLALPVEAQFSPVYCIELTDVNKDGNVDIILGGNLYGAQPETGRYDASYGNILINDGKAGFTDATHQYGLSVKGEVRSVIAIGTNVFFFINNSPVRVLQFR